MTDHHNKENIDYYKSLDWVSKNWKPSSALIDKSGFATHQYVGQKYDSNYLTIDPQGWTHDHCEICSKTFCENEEICETHGFVSDNLWICSSCYNCFIK